MTIKGQGRSLTLSKVTQIQHFYTPGIYAEGYVVFIFPFVRSYVCMLVCLLNLTLTKIMSKFCVKSFSNGYISITTHQKAFIYGPLIPWVHEFWPHLGWWISVTQRLASLNRCGTVTYISWSSDFALYLEDYLIDEGHTWYNRSLWHKGWLHKIYIYRSVT